MSSDRFLPPSTASNKALRAATITRHAKAIFSAYRRDDFADPDGFVLQLGLVLERYADDVIQYVCDPRTGIQRRSKFPPSIAEVVEACEAEAGAIETRKKYAAIPKPNLNRERLRPPPAGPGAFATIKVPPGVPQYDKFKARTATADPREWRWEGGAFREGATLYVPMSWFDAPSALKPLPVPSQDDLRRMYPPREPAPAEPQPEEIEF